MNFVRTHSFSSHLLKKLHYLIRLPILHIIFKLFDSMQKCSIALCLVPLQPCLLPPMVGFVGTQAKVLRVSSYVRNLDTFHLSTTRNPDQTDQSTSYKKTKILQDVVKHCPGFFLRIFSSLACLKKPVFTKAGSSAVEDTSETVLGSSDQRKVRASLLSLFLKSEKIPALLYVGKGPEYRPFHDLFSRPAGLGHMSQISYVGPSPIHNSRHN